MKPSDQWWRWATLELAKELAARDLRAEDVVTIEGLGMFRPRSDNESARSLEQAVDCSGMCGPPPEPLFTVARIKFWLFDDIFAWLVPLLDRRGRQKIRAEDERARIDTRRQAALPCGPRGVAGFYGIKFQTRVNRWSAYPVPSPGGQHRHLGSWDTPEEAARAVDRVRIAEGYPPLNFPNDAATTKQLPDPRDLPSRQLPKGSIVAAAQAILDRGEDVTIDAVMAELDATLGRCSSKASINKRLRTMAQHGQLQRLGRGRFQRGQGRAPQPQGGA